MTDFTDDPTLEDARRKAARKAHLEASQAASTAAAMEAHRATSAHLRAAHQGIYGSADGYTMAAVVAASNARVGDGVGAGRDLVAQGGAFAHHLSGPAPARVSLAGQDAPPGFRRTENPLVRWSRENR